MLLLFPVDLAPAEDGHGWQNLRDGDAGGSDIAVGERLADEIPRCFRAQVLLLDDVH